MSNHWSDFFKAEHKFSGILKTNSSMNFQESEVRPSAEYYWTPNRPTSPGIVMGDASYLSLVFCF